MRAVFDSLEAVINVRFEQVFRYSSAQLVEKKEMNSFFDSPGTAGEHEDPDDFHDFAGGDQIEGSFNIQNPAWTGMTIGGTAFQTMLHEVMHGLGLDHPHEYLLLPGVPDGAEFRIARHRQPEPDRLHEHVLQQAVGRYAASGYGPSRLRLQPGGREGSGRSRHRGPAISLRKEHDLPHRQRQLPAVRHGCCVCGTSTAGHLLAHHLGRGRRRSDRLFRASAMPPSTCVRRRCGWKKAAAVS